MNRVQVRRHHRAHPWIFSNELMKKVQIQPGEIVDIYHGSSFKGRGFYNPHSLIAVRRYSETKQEFDKSFVDALITKAFEDRKKHMKDTSFRLVYSESDGLPGLIVDKYEENFVIQIHCYGMDIRRDLIVRSLLGTHPEFIYDRSDTPLRKLEGLQPRKGLLHGLLVNPVLIKQDNIALLVDVENGQKTGFFFDLLDIRNKVKNISRGKRVLDLFCYTGAFSLYAASGGAHSIIGVDSSESAITLAIENSKINGITNTKFICAEAFNFLRNDNHLYDIIILDPPSFTKSKKSLVQARRGYKQINLEAMKHLNLGGILVTTSCSYHVREEIFQEIIRKAAVEAGISLRITDRATQSYDHPILLNMPESHYLKCFFLQRVD
jgi:23S rRNA (cytosine1962-C5)-methyltransferase